MSRWTASAGQTILLAEENLVPAGHGGATRTAFRRRRLPVGAFEIAFAYAVFASLWIIFSDNLLAWLVTVRATPSC